jgi:RNA polymerase sigma-70 factor (ECF subfamily)
MHGEPPQPPATRSTRWSRLEALRGPDAEAAWGWFQKRYQAFVADILAAMFRSRRLAEDATEEFWGYLFQHRIDERADRGRRFRTYLSGVVRRFGLDWRDRQQSRDGLVDLASAEHGNLDTPAEDVEMHLFTRSLVLNALHRMESGADVDGQVDARRADAISARTLRLFYGIPDRLGDELPAPRKSSEVARELGLELTDNAINVRLHRARRSFRELVVNEVRHTVPDEAQFVDELRLVLESIGRLARGLVEPA